MSNTSLTKWILEFLGIRGVKFQVYIQQDLEFLEIPTQSTNDFPWKAVNQKKIPRNF